MSDYSITLDDPISLTVTAPTLEIVGSDNSYAYPQLSQTTSYSTGDEGWQIANTYSSIYGGNTTDRRAIIGLSDFYTLESNNQFGNTQRFTTPAGLTLASDGTDFDAVGDRIYDNYLGVQFYRMENTTDTWAVYVAAAIGISAFSGGWLPIPMVVMDQITDKERTDGNKHFNFMTTHWCGTTSPDATTFGMYFFTSRGTIERLTKTSTRSFNMAYKLI